MVGDRRPYLEVDHSQHGLPEDFDESYPPVFAISLWKENNRLLCALGWKGAVPERGMNQVHEPPPSCRSLGPATLSPLKSTPGGDPPVSAIDRLNCGIGGYKLLTLSCTPGGHSFLLGTDLYPPVHPPPGDGMCVYRATLYAVILEREIRTEGGGRLVVELYHTSIHCHTSLTRGGSDVKSNSTDAPDSSTIRFLSLLKRTLILRSSALVLVLN